MRNLLYGIPATQWRAVIDQAIRVLKLGGYLEILDTDFTLQPERSPAVKQLNEIRTCYGPNSDKDWKRIHSFTF
jgi:hypothetical protein